MFLDSLAVGQSTRIGCGLLRPAYADIAVFDPFRRDALTLERGSH